MVSQFFHLMWFLLSFYHFITLISGILIKSITPSMFLAIQLSHDCGEAVSSDVRELGVPPKGIIQQMSQFGQLQPGVNFPFDVPFPEIYNRMGIPHVYNV